MPEWIHWIVHFFWLPVIWVATHRKEAIGLAKSLCPKIVNLYLIRRRELDCVRLAFQTTTEEGEVKRFELEYRMPRSHCNPTDLRSAMTNLFGDKDKEEGFAVLRDHACFHLTFTNQISLASIRKIHEMVVECDAATFSLVEAALCVRKLPFAATADIAKAA